MGSSQILPPEPSGHPILLSTSHPFLTFLLASPSTFALLVPDTQASSLMLGSPCTSPLRAAGDTPVVGMMVFTANRGGPGHPATWS